jgi:hypothetical protein
MLQIHVNRKITISLAQLFQFTRCVTTQCDFAQKSNKKSRSPTKQRIQFYGALSPCSGFIIIFDQQAARAFKSPCSERARHKLSSHGVRLHTPSRSRMHKSGGEKLRAYFTALFRAARPINCGERERKSSSLVRVAARPSLEIYSRTRVMWVGGVSGQREGGRTAALMSGRTLFIINADTPRPLLII